MASSTTPTRRTSVEWTPSGACTRGSTARHSVATRPVCGGAATTSTRASKPGLEQAQAVRCKVRGPAWRRDSRRAGPICRQARLDSSGYNGQCRVHRGRGISRSDPMGTGATDLAARISIVGWAVAIPLLAALAMLNVVREWYRYTSYPFYWGIAWSVAHGAALIALGAAFWHIWFPAAIVLTASDVVGIALYQVSVHRLL